MKAGINDENSRIRSLIEVDKGSLPEDGGGRFNRLIFATSPYLLQHAENPVDWYPWGEEAFEKARRENKPVFLSIGYATCHWCHVMAHESFENREVAAVINRYFVPIKVDREERPDVDSRYMTAAQMITGSAGWPLTIMMTPEREPFFAATYLPRDSRMGMPGIIELLDRIAVFWRMEPEKVAESCASIMAALNRYGQLSQSAGKMEDAWGNAMHQLITLYDEDWGGFGQAPKFPMPGQIFFLLRSWKKTSDKRAIAMVDKTLRQMRQGGIFDQLGFGIHRYSVDREWLVPHFEKMLYDQALVSLAYLEAYQATRDSFHIDVAEEIFDFVLRDLALPDGGFAAALDADTEGEEGKYYVWRVAEVRNVLGEDATQFFCRLFGMTEKGNFEGTNVLHLPLTLQQFTAREGIDQLRLRGDLSGWRERLLAERSQRVRPFRDEKRVTAWNGLMIAALAKGYAVTGNETYRRRAEEAAAFMCGRLIVNGRLMRSFHLGRASVPGFLEDYAFLAMGILSLYEANGKKEYLESAAGLCREMISLFRDDESRAFFDSGSDTEEVLMRNIQGQDSVIPSGNAVAAMVLIKLGKLFNDSVLLEAGQGIVLAVSGDAFRQPIAHLGLLMAGEFADAAAVELTISGPPDSEVWRRMVHAAGRRFMPNLVLRFAAEGEWAEYVNIGEDATAYLCVGGACRRPAATVADLENLLDSAL